MRRYKITSNVGKRIRKLRREKGLSQEDLSDKIHMHVSTLGRIERGESNAPIQTINRIAQALKVKVKDLL